MKSIYFNSAVARRCGKNGIIKAVLLNYIYNYYRQNPRKKAGFPATITLTEFIYQYSEGDKSLWKRSYIHKTLTELCKAGYLIKTEVNRMPEYTVSSEIADLLNDENAVLVGFDLGLACEFGIQVAIMSRYLLHVIDHSHHGVAYNLNVNDMSEVNCISVAEIYRAIKQLEVSKVVQRVKSPIKKHSRSLCLARCNPNEA